MCQLIILVTLLFIYFACGQYDDGYSEYENHVENPKTALISSILNNLTDGSRYDKRLRPNYGGETINVGITIHVTSISAVSEVDMDFTLDFYLRQTWRDPRLAFANVPGVEGALKELTVGVDYLEKLWKPDTFFPNEKKSFFHSATTHNSFLRIDTLGNVYTSQRLTVTATCPMKLQLFPLDSQQCKLGIESYGYTTADIDYFWGRNRSIKNEPDIIVFNDVSLPQFKLTGYNITNVTAITSSGNYNRLYFEVNLSRNLGFYLMNIIIPSMLIVTISWVSFWLNREASPARVGLGVTTVLTMTTLITTTNNAMPKVSYIKGLDVFLNFCFVMVFASLVEYAVVSYMNKKLAQRRERRRKQAEQQMPVEMPMFNNQLTSKPNVPVDMYIGPRNPSMGMVEIPGDCDCRTIPLMQHPRLIAGNSMWPAPFGKAKKATRTCRSVTPSKIDKCSRYIFPLLFVTFNLTYWTALTLLTLLEDKARFTPIPSASPQQNTTSS